MMTYDDLLGLEALFHEINLKEDGSCLCKVRR